MTFELAHGVGSRGDLPLPVWMFTWAASIALVLSFVALGLLWTEPRLARAGTGRVVPVPAVVRWMVVVARVGALVLYLTALTAGLLGVDDPSANLLPVTLYVVVWVGALVLSGLVGDLWRVVNPLVTLARILERLLRRSSEPAPESRPSMRSSQLAGAVGLFVFLFYELAHPFGASPRSLGWLLAIHTLISLAVTLRWGSRWLGDYEPFSALSGMVAGLAPLVVDRVGRSTLRIRPPLTGLASMPTSLGTPAVLLVVLGGTTFDGFVESRLGRSVFGRPEGWNGAVALTLGLVGSILLVGLLYAMGAWWVAQVTGGGLAEVLASFSPSLVPIVFGYAVAHYAQLLVDETQSFLFRLSDPFGRGWDLFGTAGGEVDFTLLSPDAIAWVQVLAILLGHVGAVIAAHDRSLELYPQREAWRSQFAMLAVMVAYSTLGLWLLLSA